MIFLATTRSGYESYRSLGKVAGALWLAAKVLSAEELRELREAGTDVTDFDYEISSEDADVVAGAVETIKEHHPGEAIWVEASGA